MKNFKRETEITADGSVTLYIPEIDEHYHSTNGAFIEANHVYITEAMMHRINKGTYPFAAEADDSVVIELKEINLLEVGFGTGLNAFLTMLKSLETGVKVHYVTLELYPLTPEQTSVLNYPQLISPESGQLFKDIHAAPWNVPVQITDTFTIEKREISLVTDELTGCFDVVYYDAFAPEKQPDMWSEEIYAKVVKSMNKGGVLTTYCAKGVVRRGFRDAGLTMERIPGPPGKREMLRGNLL